MTWATMQHLFKLALTFLQFCWKGLKYYRWNSEQSLQRIRVQRAIQATAILKIYSRVNSTWHTFHLCIRTVMTWTTKSTEPCKMPIMKTFTLQKFLQFTDSGKIWCLELSLKKKKKLKNGFFMYKKKKICLWCKTLWNA